VPARNRRVATLLLLAGTVAGVGLAEGQATQPQPGVQRSMRGGHCRIRLIRAC